VKKKNRKVAKSMPDESKLPDWLEGEPSGPAKPYTKEQQEELAAGIEKGIRDTPVWKDMVRRVGLKEARRILKLGILSNQLPDGNPQN
jgi:hypothetical protein